MAENDSIFEDGENLQAAIGKALQESKALLCFVSDESDESARWADAFLDQRIREKLQSSTVLLRLKAGSEQAGFLGSVCPVQNTPAIIIIHNAQVVANYQNGQTTFEQLQKQLTSRYASSEEDQQLNSSDRNQQSSPSSTTTAKAYFDLPAPDGRMRLPNNAYDYIRKLTQQYVLAGVGGSALLHVQLILLESLKIDMVTAAVEDIRERLGTITEPTLPEEVVDRLLNTPAARIQAPPTPHNQPTASNPTTSTASTTQADTPSSPPNSSQSTAPVSAAPPSTQDTDNAPRANTPHSSQQTHSNASSSRESQRAQYIVSQKSREATQNAERARIKAQIAADKAARRESEAVAAAEQRRIDLHNLRKANSTTADPKASDVRIQVRLFDGSTIRNSFPAEASVAKEVRDWIDGEVARKAVSGGAVAGQPYNLKLILTPLPTRTIEAGEEDAALCDLEGVKGSATMVMVPVRGFVDSYSGAAGGIVGGVVGGATSVVGTGIGLVGTAAGMVMGGLGRLLGAGAAQSSQPSAQRGDATVGEQTAGLSSGARTNMRVRTLADQRSDEEDERRKRGTDLYNGMGLNVQPRKDDDGKKD